MIVGKFFVCYFIFVLLLNLLCVYFILVIFRFGIFGLEVFKCCWFFIRFRCFLVLCIVLIFNFYYFVY